MVDDGALRCQWLAGFAVSFVLGDLGLDEFTQADPMVEASMPYLKAVAGVLEQRTGLPWKAHRRAPAKRSFAVFPSGVSSVPPRAGLAFVDLATPMLPFDDAERLRSSLQDCVDQMGGRASDPDAPSDGLEWRIALSSDSNGQQAHIDPVRLAVFVDEVEMLTRSARMGRRTTGLQRHAFGTSLLRDIAYAPELMEPDVNLEQLIRRNGGLSGIYGARFPSLGEVELAWFGAPEFLSPASLLSLVSPALHAFEASNKSTHRELQYLLSVFRILQDWLSQVEKRFELRMTGPSGFSFERSGSLYFDGKEIGSAIWQGDTEFGLWGRLGHFEQPLAVFGKGISEAAECFALLCLDALEVEAITGEMPVGCDPLAKEIARLKERLEAEGLLCRSRLFGGEMTRS